MVNQHFPKERRLLKAEYFKRVFDLPDKKLSNKHILLLIRYNKLCYPRLGTVISKKNVRLAVERNRLKRQIRETFRLYQNSIQNFDIVVIARKGLADIQNKTLNKQLIKFLENLSCKEPKQDIS